MVGTKTTEPKAQKTTVDSHLDMLEYQQFSQFNMRIDMNTIVERD